MNNRAHPFLKWAGGKRWLAASKQLPPANRLGNYIEPFLGGGAIFFSVQPEQALLSDLNPELINAYTQIRDHANAINDGLAQHHLQHCKEHYYNVRSTVPSDGIEAAIRFIYLNRTCWNGLYRVNREGKFNVPIGTKIEVAFDEGELRAVASALSDAEIRCCDFEDSIDRAEAGDYLFVDPPYTANHNFNGFLKYNENMFSWADQVRLQAAVVRAIARGAQVVVTNADHESVRELYQDVAAYRQVWRSSVLAGKASTRGRTSEALFVANFAE